MTLKEIRSNCGSLRFQPLKARSQSSLELCRSNRITSGLPTIRELIGSGNTAAFFILQWIGWLERPVVRWTWRKSCHFLNRRHTYCSFAYSDFASRNIGMSGSASFQSLAARCRGVIQASLRRDTFSLLWADWHPVVDRQPASENWGAAPKPERHSIVGDLVIPQPIEL
jgi:hypothetical protein